MASWLRIHKVDGREIAALVLARGERYCLTFAVTGDYAFPPDEYYTGLESAKLFGDNEVLSQFPHECQMAGCEEWKQFAN
jgi:hypothetical protein